jgi:hypothetical protein
MITELEKRLMWAIQQSQALGQTDVTIAGEDVLALLQMVHDARRPLVWTSEKPTAPGWYWHQYGEGRRAELINVHGQIAITQRVNIGRRFIKNGIEQLEGIIEFQTFGPNEGWIEVTAKSHLFTTVLGCVPMGTHMAPFSAPYSSSFEIEFAYINPMGQRRSLVECVPKIPELT